MLNCNRGLRKNVETVTVPTPNIAYQDREKLEQESAYESGTESKKLLNGALY